jgi:predicted phosphodiesterase
MHYDVGDTHCSEFGDDIRNALEFFRTEDVDFIASCGDFIQYSDDDFYGFYDLYRKHAGNIRLFTPMGNHDYLRVYDERQKTAPDYKDESQRQMMWQDTIADLHCRPEIEDRKSAEAESDIHFYEYGAEWDDPKHTGERTIKSKLSYWTERHGDIYVFLSLDYGKDTIPGTWGTLANAVSLLDDTDDVRRLREYVSDTGYDESRERKFDYMFYHPGVLLWLKGLIEDNPDKRIFVFTHHYLTHKAGGNSPLNRKWFYSQMRVWPYTEDERIRKRYYSGANSLCGVEFHFINKLNNLYKNVVWFSGHTHIRCVDEKYDPHLMFCDDDFAYVAPDGNEKVPLVDDIWQYANTSYDYRRYTRKSEDSIGKCGLNVHLPSLSKPIEIESGHGTTMYGASEGAVMEVWTDRIVISGYTFKDAGEKGYKNEKVVERSFRI